MKVAIVGAGGHGKVVCDAILEAGQDEIVGFADDDLSLTGRLVLGFCVIGPLTRLGKPGTIALAMGIGNNAARRLAHDRAIAFGYHVVSVVHPSAVVARSSVIKPGTVLLAGVVVNADSLIGPNAILNTGCRIDHDCVVGAHAHIAPGATLAGMVTVGDEALIGAGTVVIPGRTIGPRSTTGAGTVVIRDVPPDCVVVGVPGRAIKTVAEESR